MFRKNWCVCVCVCLCLEKTKALGQILVLRLNVFGIACEMEGAKLLQLNSIGVM